MRRKGPTGATTNTRPGRRYLSKPIVDSKVKGRPNPLPNPLIARVILNRANPEVLERLVGTNGKKPKNRAMQKSGK